MNELHAVIGYGNLGAELVRTLKDAGTDYRIVSRHAVDDPHYVSGDAGDLESLIAATKDVTHAYLTIGLEYKYNIWAELWPVIMQNVIKASKANGFKIIFFDNIYMYGPAPLSNPITEDHEQSPSSKKGLVRKQIADTLLAAHQAGEARALIARSPDFYGPNVTNSLLYVSAIQNQLKGKKPQLVTNPHTKHNFIYLPDAAKAMLRLAADESAYGQVWHLPTAPATYTTAELLDISATMSGAPKSYSVVPKALYSVLQIFIPILKELREMQYQTDSDYNFSSQKFMAKYPEFAITDYQTGLQATVDSFRQKPAS